MCMTNEDIMKVVKPAICSQLKSPASAQFPIDAISIAGDDKSGYHIEGFVDSQNSYGAMIRNDFTAEVTIVNGCPHVTYCSVAKKADARRAKEFGVNYLVVLLYTIIGGAGFDFLISLIVGM